MYEYQTEIRPGEQSPGFAQITVPGSSATFTTTAAYFQLLFKDHTPVTGTVTNFSSTVTAQISADVSKVFYNLLKIDTTALPVTDYFIGRFTQQGSPDSIVREKITDIQIVTIY